MPGQPRAYILHNKLVVSSVITVLYAIGIHKEAHLQRFGFLL